MLTSIFLWVFKSISYSFAALTCEISSRTLEEIPYLLAIMSYFAYNKTNHVLLPIIKNILITKFLTIFRRFPKILQKLYQGRKTFEKDPKIIRSYISNFKSSLRVKTWSQRSHQYLYWWRYGKYPTRVPRVVSYKFYEWCIFQETTCVYIIKKIIHRCLEAGMKCCEIWVTCR